jgi:hypothetical protein
MEKMQEIRHRDSVEFGQTAMPWMDFGVYQPPEMEILGHGGGTDGCSAFIVFDKKHRRGAVVLANHSSGSRKYLCDRFTPPPECISRGDGRRKCPAEAGIRWQRACI